MNGSEPNETARSRRRELDPESSGEVDAVGGVAALAGHDRRHHTDPHYRPSSRAIGRDRALPGRATAVLDPEVDASPDHATRSRGPTPPDSAKTGRETVRVAIKPRPTYIPALDGLRALSVAAVVAFHLGLLPGGFIGVDVFFVISGFLITRLLLAEHEASGTVALGAFWSRRFRRLVPALAVVLVGVPRPDMTIELPFIEVFGRGGSLKSSWYGDCLPSRDFPMLVDLHLQGRLPLDKFVSETIGLDAVEEAFHKMERGEVLRSVVVI